jgi:hydroxymethylbilane synthase
LENALHQERATLRTFGGGCHQRFGAVSVRVGEEDILLANGKDEHGESAEMMRFSVPDALAEKRIFAASDFMRDFFTTSYEAVAENWELSENAVFVSHHRAAHNEAVLKELRQKRVWTAGTRTWFELAKRGVWVEGCSDGFGLKFLENVVSMPLVSLPLPAFHILTNTESARDWQREGFAATGLYTLHEAVSSEIQAALSNAEACFWTSFGQYRACRAWVREGALHLCPSGRTAERFRAEGIEPVIFPSIKAFLLWQKNHR